MMLSLSVALAILGGSGPGPGSLLIPAPDDTFHLGGGCDIRDLSSRSVSVFKDTAHHAENGEGPMSLSASIGTNQAYDKSTFEAKARVAMSALLYGGDLAASYQTDSYSSHSGFAVRLTFRKQRTAENIDLTPANIRQGLADEYIN